MLDEKTVRLYGKVHAMIARMNALLITVEAMRAANHMRERMDGSLAYKEKDFHRIADELRILTVDLENL